MPRGRGNQQGRGDDSIYEEGGAFLGVGRIKLIGVSLRRYPRKVPRVIPVTSSEVTGITILRLRGKP